MTKQTNRRAVSRLMRMNPFNSLSAVLLAVLAIYVPQISRAQPTVGNTTNTAQVSAVAQTNVTVFFGTHKTMNIEELSGKAKEALQAKGYQIDESYQCIINVVLGGKPAGCFVMFSKGFGRMFYEVDFNAKGDVTKTEGGILKEGGPQIPEGATPVKP